MAINELQNKITQHFTPIVNINHIITTNIAQFYDMKLYHNDIYIVEGAKRSNLGFYDSKLLKEMDNMTLKQLSGGV